MRKFGYAALAAALLAPGAAAQQGRETLTLDLAVSMAVRNSPAVLAAEQDISIAKQRVREARFMYLPQFTLSATASRVNLEYPAVLGPELGEHFLDPSISDTFYTLRAQALQPLYTGGKNTNALKLAKASQNQARVNYEAFRAEAAFEAKKAFYTVLYQRRLGAASAAWLAAASALNSGLRKEPFEALEASALVSGLEDKAKMDASGADAAYSDLLRALNREPGYAADLAGEFKALPVETDPGRDLVTAMEFRPELKSELFKAQIDDIIVNLAMTRRYPTIYLGASYDVNAYRINDLTDSSVRANNWLASLAIHFPLSYDVWTQVQQRRAQQRQGELRRVELQDKVRFEILSSHKDAVFWQGEAAKLEKELAAMKASYAEASRGARPSLQALRALCAVSELDRRAAEAVYRQLMARIRLELARGRDLAGRN
jgi:outer membrane protein TolC